MTHLALGAYSRGELTEAIALAEDSMAQAHLRGDARVEAIAANNLGLFRFWTGDFRIAEHAANLGLRAIQRIAEPENRYEEALLVVVLGAVACIRNDFASGDEYFDRALTLADSRGNRWHDAIIRTVRAELTAARDPFRAIEDVRVAVQYFNWAEESWFVHWTHQALAVAHRELGNTTASLGAAQSLLDRPLNRLERGRALLCLGETHVRAENSEARARASRNPSNSSTRSARGTWRRRLACCSSGSTPGAASTSYATPGASPAAIAMTRRGGTCSGVRGDSRSSSWVERRC